MALPRVHKMGWSEADPRVFEESYRRRKARPKTKGRGLSLDSCREQLCHMALNRGVVTYEGQPITSERFIGLISRRYEEVPEHFQRYYAWFIRTCHSYCLRRMGPVRTKGKHIVAMRAIYDGDLGLFDRVMPYSRLSF